MKRNETVQILELIENHDSTKNKDKILELGIPFVNNDNPLLFLQGELIFLASFVLDWNTLFLITLL
jgi:hypothetical protein